MIDLSKLKTPDRSVVDRFLTERATSADTARALIPLSTTDRSAWRRLQRSGIIREAGNGRVYLDRHRLAETRQLQRMIRFAVIGLALAGVLLQLLLSRP